MDNMNDDLFPLALLIDELKHDDVANRVAAMQKLDAIAIALGPERALQELVPFLNDVVQDDEEEVFAVMAEKLGSFVPLVGGHAHSEPVVRVLALLALMEEPIVRDNAVESLNHISTELTDEEANGLFLEMVRDLAHGDWFLKKVSLCGLFKAVVARVDASTRRDLLMLYYTLVLDDSPMVRRSAAKHLPEIIGKLTDAGAPGVGDSDLEVILKMFHHLITDAQDSVKLLSVDVLLAILRYFHSVNDHSHNADCLVSALKLVKDDSWRVRYAAADQFAAIARSLAHSLEDVQKLTEPFIGLMRDNEGEVRRAVARQLPEFCTLIKDLDLVEKKIIPVVGQLAQDAHENVRAAVAASVTGLCPLLAEQAAIDTLLPIFLNMLKDEFPDVRLNIILNLSVVNETIGIALLLTSLLPAITELAQDNKWRVRLAIIEYIPKLAHQLGEPFFNNELLTLCMSWLWDPVYAVREAAVNNLHDLTVIFGSSWAEQHIVSRLLSIKDEQLPDADADLAEHVDFSNFIIRITCLFVVSKLTPVLDQSVIVSKILPFVSHLTADPVPNIRFNVAKSYLVIVEALAKNPDADVSKLIDDEIVRHLNVLQGDADVDVRYYANSSLDSIKELLQKAN